MKRFVWLLLFSSLPILLSAQIRTPVRWESTVKATDEESVFRLVYTAVIEPGWHLYDIRLPENGPLPTSVHYETLEGAELLGTLTAKSPATSVFDSNFGMELSWFAEKAVLTQAFRITDRKGFRIAGYIRYMSCNDESCLPPTSESFAFDRNQLPDPEKRSAAAGETPKRYELTSDTPARKPEPAAATDENRTTVSRVLPSLLSAEEASKQTVPDSIRTRTIRQEPAPPADSLLWTPVTGSPYLHDSIRTADRSLWTLFFWGFAGGLLALLTPCVWPMIPMTVSFFLKRSGSRRKSMRDALLYGGAIVVIYLLLGLLVTLLFGASALNSLATNAVFNLLFFALLLLFAVSFLGGFELRLPASWSTRLDRKADTTSGIVSLFFMAFTLVLVSFSCTGPIIGTLLVEAATLGSVAGPAAGMAGFAVALALPFALFAVFPTWLQQLPKSGGWMNTVKVVLGFLELAFAFKFLSVADLAYGWGILDREIFLAVWIVIFTFLGLFLAGKIRLGYEGETEQPIKLPRFFLAMGTLAFALYLVPGLWGAPLKGISAFSPPLATQDFSLYDNAVHARFDSYESGMRYAAETGKPVLLDFSGYGCVNCRKMEAAVWTDPRVKSLIDNDYVLITLMVDDKRPLPEPIRVRENGKETVLRTVGDRWSYLQRHKFGANAQPYYVLLTPDGELLAPPYAYDESANRYVDFLTAGLKAFRTER